MWLKKRRRLERLRYGLLRVKAGPETRGGRRRSRVDGRDASRANVSVMRWIAERKEVERARRCPTYVLPGQGGREGRTRECGCGGVSGSDGGSPSGCVPPKAATTAPSAPNPGWLSARGASAPPRFYHRTNCDGMLHRRRGSSWRRNHLPCPRCRLRLGTDSLETNTHLCLTDPLGFLPIVECRREEGDVKLRDELGRGACEGIRRARSREGELTTIRQATGQ